MADNIIIEGGFFSDKQIIAEDFATAFSGLVSNGVLETIDNNALKVTAGTGMNLNVSRGYFWVDGQFGKNGTSTVVTIDIGDSEYSRYDRVVARVNKTTKTAEIGVLKGTANANPVAPNITRDGTIFELSLATIEIPATATELTTANIQDNRADTDLCGFCTPKFDEIDTSAVFDGFYAEWEHFKGQLANDPAGNLQFQIGNLNNLETENKENLVEAINESMRIIDGIPVDLTGIYNTQVIGYDETQGKLVPMLSGTVPQQNLIPSGEIPRIWDITSEGNFSIVDANSPTLQTVETPLTSNDFLVMQVEFKKPYMLSEYSKINLREMNAYAYNHGWIEPESNALCQLDVEISKKSDFSNVDMYYKSDKSNNVNYPISKQSVDITSLKGFYYIRMKLFISSTATNPKILANKTLTFPSVWLS